MRNIIKTLAVALIASVFLIGCRTNPILNIQDAPIQVSSKHSDEDISKAILRAGASLGWRMQQVDKGHMTGTLTLREHVAIVDIKYSRKSYSITYKDSTNLKYDGTTIHSNYNGWVMNLDRNIRVQLDTL